MYLSDMDGHYEAWFTDGSGRLYETQRWASGLWLTSSQTWDNNNNLLGVTSPLGWASGSANNSYETDYAYDNNGNVVAMALPAVSSNNGQYRPTYVMSYDTSSNMTAFCDPVQSHVSQLDWSGTGQTGNPGTSDSRCPSSVGAKRFTWKRYIANVDTSGDPNEPFGEMTDVYNGNGYHYSVGYNSNGLATSISGTGISQSIDSSTPTRTPQLTVTYNPTIETIASIATASGSTSYQYDSMNRLTAVTDADGHGQYTCYNPDGTISYTETASQHSADNSPSACLNSPPTYSVSYQYDVDEEPTSVRHHFGNIQGVTTQIYDGADRLVEVEEPHDSTLFPNSQLTHDLYSSPWLERYLYDNTGSWLWGDSDNNAVYASGGLYKVQEYTPDTSPTVRSPAQWRDVRGWAMDTDDRPLHMYEFPRSGGVPQRSFIYDAGSYLGKLTTVELGDSSSAESETFSYNAIGNETAVSYANDGGVTPARQFTYDADGRATAENNASIGTESYAYDADGNVTGYTEPTGVGNYANISYSYYGDGLRQSMTVSSSALRSSTSMNYAYRADSLLEVQQLSWMASQPFKFTYTNAGRPLTETDPYTGQAIGLYATNGSSTGTSRQLVQRQIGYDQFGRVQSLTLPEGYSYGAFSYDTEDEPTGFTLSNGLCIQGSTSVTTCSPGATTLIYSSRGELLADTTPTGSSTQQAANGQLCTPDGNGGCVEGWEATDDSIWGYDGINYRYDNAGRQTTLFQSTSSTCAGCGNTITRAYDAEDHLLSQTNSGTTAFTCTSGIELGCISGSVAPGSGSSFSYDPSGLVAHLTTPTSIASWEHWDIASHTVLFENGTQSSSNFLDLAAGLLGVSNLTQGITVEDRDPFGQLAATHTGNQFADWSLSQPLHYGRFGPISGGTGSNYPQTDPALANRVLTTPRTDAFVDQNDGLSFQGERVADINTGQWMTQDSFAGLVTDPMSEQPYLWNNNNGLLSIDPNGTFTTVCNQSMESGSRAPADCNWQNNFPIVIFLPPPEPIFGDVPPRGGIPRDVTLPKVTCTPNHFPAFSAVRT